MNADPRRLLLHGYGAKTGQAFAHFIDPDREVWLGVDDSMLAILERGPRSQRYRMTWDDVLSNAIHEDADGRTWRLHYDRKNDALYLDEVKQ